MVRRILKYSALFILLATTSAILWLRWDAGRPRDDWFNERQGQIASSSVETSITRFGQWSASVELTSTTGLQVKFRVIRDTRAGESIPVLLTLGGHRTGSDAVDLFGDVGHRAVVGLDYPYDGPEKVKGAVAIAQTIPQARQAFLDTVPAVSLVVDWLEEQPWVDPDRIIIAGVSLGVPFAATAARRDDRIAGAVLVHGAADNRLWMETQVARRIDTEFLHYPLSVVLYWLAYGPILDTGQHVTHLTPRPLLIINARDDERTPDGQAQMLFAAAGEPKRLRFSEGKHIQPNRTEIIAELLQIIDDEMDFLIEGE
jgi:dienelactone hydrolase